jgi:hypothetical protein
MTDSPDIPEGDLIAESFRAELEAEHEERQRAQVDREQRARSKRRTRQTRDEVLAESEIKERVRAEFYKEKGYKLYTDSAGRQHWLTPEEHAWRTAARARRDSRRRSYQPSIWVRQKQLLMYGGAVLIAVALGLFLVK